MHKETMTVMKRFFFSVTELYPNHGSHGHSTSPNLPIADVKWEHSLPHNPYTAHPIYSTSNLMPLSQNMAPTASLTSNVQPSTSPITNLSSNTLQNLPPPQQTEMSEYKDGNDNTVQHSSSPAAQQGYNNMPPTPTSIVTMLGPNSGKFYCKFLLIKYIN